MRRASVRIMVLAVLPVAAAVFVSCSIEKPGTTILPNGAAIDQQTKDRLVALQGDYDALLAVKQAAARSAPPADGAEAYEPLEVQAARELLLREFGEAGLDYIICGEFDNLQIIESRPEVDARGYAIPAGEDSLYVFYLRGDAKWSTWPWGSVEWVISTTTRTSKITGEGSYQDVAGLSARIVDAETPSPGNENSGGGIHSITATANYRWGFFPPRAAPGYGYCDAYDVRLWNGHASLMFYWE